MAQVTPPDDSTALDNLTLAGPRRRLLGEQLQALHADVNRMCAPYDGVAGPVIALSLGRTRYEAAGLLSAGAALLLRNHNLGVQASGALATGLLFLWVLPRKYGNPPALPVCQTLRAVVAQVDALYEDVLKAEGVAYDNPSRPALAAYLAALTPFANSLSSTRKAVLKVDRDRRS